LDVSNAKAVLEALEQDSQTKILARPKILTLDNESATIELTSNQAVSFSTTSAPLTQTTSVTAERVQTGVSLIVTPQVNDNGWITMVLEPKVTKTVKAAVSPPSGQGDVVDPKTRTVKTMVRVQQGHTLVLGGLIDRSDEEVVRRIPLVSSIPIIGEAFIHRDTDKSTSELIVFVTPHILQESDVQVSSSSGFVPAPPVPAPQASRQDVMEDALNQLVQ
jgi:type II secretory pathway component GspD/PulD (secretin)